MTLSKTAKKYADIITTGIIQEREIIAIRSFMAKDKENAQTIFALLDGNDLALSEAQAEKGYAFLMDQWKTSRGVERKNNPFGYREQSALETFESIVLKSLYNAGKFPHDYYLPLYEVTGKRGSFEYYYDGKINITG
jgi:hypothetical protein